MSRYVKNENFNIPDRGPSRKRKLIDVEANIPPDITLYNKLSIPIRQSSILLSFTLLEDPLKVFKHFLRDSDYAIFAHNTNINAFIANAGKAFKAGER
jgi:hypothetical protein